MSPWAGEAISCGVQVASPGSLAHLCCRVEGARPSSPGAGGSVGPRSPSLGLWPACMVGAGFVSTEGVGDQLSRARLTWPGLVLSPPA